MSRSVGALENSLLKHYIYYFTCMVTIVMAVVLYFSGTISSRWAGCHWDVQ